MIANTQTQTQSIREMMVLTLFYKAIIETESLMLPQLGKPSIN